MTLPSAPLDTAAPAWAGYAASHAIRPAGDPAPAVASVPSAASSITGDQLTAHLARPDAWRSLPDGRPLRLCADALEYIADDFGGYDPGSLRSAIRVLWFASRTAEQMDSLWVPLAPVAAEDGPARDAAATVGLAFRLRDMQMEISRWGRDTFAPCSHLGVRRLALDLWINVVDRMPVPAEKKSPEPEAETESPPECDNPTSGKCAGMWPGAMPTDTDISGTPISSSSPMPSSAGQPSTATPSSPVPASSDSSPMPAP